MSRLAPFLVTLAALAALVIVFLTYGLTAAVATGVVLTLACAATTVVLRLTGVNQPLTQAETSATAAMADPVELGGQPSSTEQPLA